MSDASSSEDEHLQRLKESVDAQFIDDSMFSDAPKPENNETAKSLRNIVSDDDERHNLFKTTPEFRKYVAGHLERILDGKLQLICGETSNVVVKKRLKSRVRLLSTSNVFLRVSRGSSDTKLINTINQTNKRRLEVVQDLETENNRIKSVVVDADYILSGVEVKNWQKRNKQTYKVDFYRKDDKGRFVLQE